MQHYIKFYNYIVSLIRVLCLTALVTEIHYC